VPGDVGARRFRYQMLANELVETGHRVTQWSATFNHFTKQQRAHRDTSVSVHPRYRVELLYGIGYRRHASPRRFLFNHNVADAFARRSKESPKPDVIVTSIPTLELSAAAITYGREHAVPVVVDVRDLWPDVFLTALPSRLRFLARPCLWPFERLANRICSDANSLIGVSQEYLDWGLRHAGREASAVDRVFPIGYARAVLTDAERREVESRWQAEEFQPLPALKCCYFGVMGRSSGVDVIIAVARKLRAMGYPDIEFLVCGNGPREEYYRSQARNLPNVHFLGWVAPADITVLMEQSDVGLTFYDGGALQSLPNKPIEYLAGGLPVLSTLRGELERILETHQCGETHDFRDIEGLAATLVRWKNKPRLRATMRARARQLFDERFAASRVYPEMVGYLEEITGHSRSLAGALRRTA
jgi:glycosyltransferase involved in cell wall biosynthesis